MQESSYQRCHLIGLGDQGDVTAAVDMKVGVRQKPRHDPGVERGDDGVVVAGENQGRLSDQREPWQAYPAETGQELMDVAAVRDAGRMVSPMRRRTRSGYSRALPP